MLNAQLVGDHGNKFRVSWLGFGDINRIAEQVGDAVDIATGPGDFNRVTDGAFYAGRRGLELLGNSRIQRLGDGTKYLNVVIDHGDGFTQVLVAFDMRRDADFMND